MGHEGCGEDVAVGKEGSRCVLGCDGGYGFDDVMAGSCMRRNKS